MNRYTKVLMNGISTTSRLSVQIFSFVDLDMVYLHCQVQICVQIGSDTCAPVSAFCSTNHKPSKHLTLHLFHTLPEDSHSRAHNDPQCSRVFLQDCLLRAARSANIIGTALGSSGPLLKLNEGEYFYTEGVDMCLI